MNVVSVGYSPTHFQMLFFSYLFVFLFSGFKRGLTIIFVILCKYGLCCFCFCGLTCKWIYQFRKPVL